MWNEKFRQKKSTRCLIPFIQNSRIYKVIYSDRNQSSGCLGTGVEGEMEYKDTKETFENDGNVCCIDYGDYVGM